MNKGKLALRLIYAGGLGAILAADLTADRRPLPSWFASAVSEATLCVGISSALLWIGFELLLHFVRHRAIWVTSFAISLIAMALPALYLWGAASAELEQANESTWHLLSLFAVAHQAMAAVFTALLAAALALILWIARRAARVIKAARAA